MNQQQVKSRLFFRAELSQIQNSDSRLHELFSARVEVRVQLIEKVDVCRAAYSASAIRHEYRRKISEHCVEGSGQLWMPRVRVQYRTADQKALNKAVYPKMRVVKFAGGNVRGCS